jgi:predicted enzyme related to lactoylglutathione lyase
MPVKSARKPAKKASRKSAPAAESFLPRRIGHVMVFVKNMKKAVAFYRDTLGLACAYESDCWSEFRTEGATLALHHAEDAAPRNTGISFNVGNVDDTVGVLVSRGVKIVRQAEAVCDDIRCASFADPEGNVLGVSGR